jgi:hypothetical protein
MSIFNKINNKLKGKEGRKREEILYEIVTAELEKGYKKKGLLAKARADCSGEEHKVESTYIKYRVQSLKDEIETKEENEQLKIKIENERRLKKLDEQDKRNRKKMEKQEAAERYRKEEESASKIQKFGWTVLWVMISIFIMHITLDNL